MKKKNLLKCLALTSMLALSVGAVTSCGAQGAQGAQGVQGVQGPKGDKGDQGEPGTPGKDGKTLLPVILAGFTVDADGNYVPLSEVIHQDKYFVEPGETFTLTWDEDYIADLKADYGDDIIVLDLQINGESVEIAPEAKDYTYTVAASDSGFQVTSASFYSVTSYAAMLYRGLWNSYAAHDVALSALGGDLKTYTPQLNSKGEAYTLATEYAVESTKLQTKFGAYGSPSTGLIKNIFDVLSLNAKKSASEKVAAITAQYEKDAATLASDYAAAVKAYKEAIATKVEEFFPEYELVKDVNGKVTEYKDKLASTGDNRGIEGSDGSNTVSVAVAGNVSVVNMSNDDRKAALEAAVASINSKTTLASAIDFLTADGTNGSLKSLEATRSEVFGLLRGDNVLNESKITGYITDCNTYKDSLKGLGLDATGPVGVYDSYLAQVSSATSFAKLASSDTDSGTLKYSIVKEAKKAVSDSYAKTLADAVKYYKDGWNADIDAFLPSDVAPTMKASVATALSNVKSFADLWGDGGRVIVQLTGSAAGGTGVNYIEAIEKALASNTTLDTARLAKYAKIATDKLAEVVKAIRDNDAGYNATLTKDKSATDKTQVDDDSKGILAAAKVIKTDIASASTVAGINKILADEIEGSTSATSIKGTYNGQVVSYRAAAITAFEAYVDASTKLGTVEYKLSTTDTGGDDKAHAKAALAAIVNAYVDPDHADKGYVNDTYTKIDTIYSQTKGDSPKPIQTTVGYKMVAALEDIQSGYKTWVDSITDDADYKASGFVNTTSDLVWTNILSAKATVLKGGTVDVTTVVSASTLGANYKGTVSKYLANSLSALSDYITTTYVTVPTVSGYTKPTGGIDTTHLAAARQKLEEIKVEDVSKLTTITKVNKFIADAQGALLLELGYTKTA